MVFAAEKFTEMSVLAKKVVDQSKEKVKGRAEEEKSRAVAEAAARIARLSERGRHG